MKSNKNSLLSGGLISSAGLVISKVMSVLYIVPFYAILGSHVNFSYYTASYNIYAYILLIATAGLPFAVSTLVSKYATHEDYRMCLLVKKVSLVTMGALGFISMVLMIVLSPMIAQAVVPDDADVLIMQTTIIILSFAVFVIPILSSIRGFYNGLKELELYSISQVIEQLIRIAFLLGAGAIAVYVFKLDHVWALYFSVFAATIAGITTIFYMQRKGRSKLSKIRTLAAAQHGELTHDAKYIFKQLIWIAVPFLLNAAFGYCDTMINTFDLKPGLEAFGELDYSSAVVSGNGQALKIIGIPMVLVPGFSAALIPYITNALEKRDSKLVKKYIYDCVETVIYISLPICLTIFVFAQPITVVLFSANEYLELYTFILQWYALEAVSATICPIFASVGMALQERNKVVMYTGIFFVIKLVTNRFLISQFGIGGMIISSFIAYLVFAILNVMMIKKKANISFMYTVRKIVLMVVGLIGFMAVAYIFKVTGLIGYTENRVLTVLLLGFMGICTCGAYVILTLLLQVPQSIFHFELTGVVSRIRGGKK